MSGLNPNAVPFVPFWGEESTALWGDMVTGAPSATVDDCSICMKKMKNEKNIAELECSHKFHKKCINEWMAIKMTCPYCRANAVVVDRAAAAAAEARRAATAEAERAYLERQQEWQTYIERNSEREMAIVMAPVADVDTGAVEYPLSCISKEGDEEFNWGMEFYTKDFVEGLVDEEKFDVGDFPNNIAEHYWVHEGHNDTDAWYLFCRIALPDGADAYAFYKASCSYTGFDGWGTMKMIVSKDAKKLFYEGMTDGERRMLLAEKTAEKATFTLWHNDVEVPLESLTWSEQKDVLYAIKGLTAKFVQMPMGRRPQKKFYVASIRKGFVSGIDDVFKRRFANPNKRWQLRMKEYALYITTRKWEKLEVTFSIN